MNRHVTFECNEKNEVTAVKQGKKLNVKLYMCGVDWQHEIGPGNARTTLLYENLEMLKRNRKCVEQCGAVELDAELTEVAWPIPQDFSGLEEANKKFEEEQSELERLRSKIATQNALILEQAKALHECGERFELIASRIDEDCYLDARQIAQSGQELANKAFELVGE